MYNRTLLTKDICLDIPGIINCIDDSGGVGIEYLDEEEAFDCLRRWMYDKRRKNRDEQDAQRAEALKQQGPVLRLVK